MTQKKDIIFTFENLKWWKNFSNDFGEIKFGRTLVQQLFPRRRRGKKIKYDVSKVRNVVINTVFDLAR